MATTEFDLALEPREVAPETFVIPWLLPAPPVGFFPMNSMVIRGTEPVIVDTGAPANREAWIRDVGNIVDLDDVRWIFLSHDDRDHAGNLLAALELCPNATLLTTWFMVGRMFEEWETPMDRVRFLNDGETFVAGDRTLLAVRPPLFDNPTTRGLFDAKTGVLWSVDTFATNLPFPTSDIDDLNDTEFADGQALGARLVAPWHAWLDDTKFQSHVDRVANLPVEVLACCHAPAITGRRVSAAFDLLRAVPGLQPYADYTQSDLDAWMEAAV